MPFHRQSHRERIPSMLTTSWLTSGLLAAKGSEVVENLASQIPLRSIIVIPLPSQSPSRQGQSRPGLLDRQHPDLGWTAGFRMECTFTTERFVQMLQPCRTAKVWRAGDEEVLRCGRSFATRPQRPRSSISGWPWRNWEWKWR